MYKVSKKKNNILWIFSKFFKQQHLSTIKLITSKKTSTISNLEKKELTHQKSFQKKTFENVILLI